MTKIFNALFTTYYDPSYLHLLCVFKEGNMNLNISPKALRSYFYHPQMKMRKGNVFTSVCQESCPQGRGRCTPPPGQTPRLGRHPHRQTPPRQTPLIRRPLQRTVRILLECILVQAVNKLINSFIFVQKKKLSELTDMMFCQRHASRSGPTEVAHFDFELPETCAGASRDGVSFSGIVEMCVIREKNMLLTHFDMYPVCMDLVKLIIAGSL